ncbi:hypothetical protein M758_2G244400 [Ceratodon purpureus]|nr:hypothetical protein M758_2G244400 [Ceratodon purpureus]
MWPVRCKCILLLQFLYMSTGLVRRWIHWKWLLRMPKTEIENVASGSLHNWGHSGCLAHPVRVPGMCSELPVTAKSTIRPICAAASAWAWGPRVRVSATSKLPAAGGANVPNQHEHEPEGAWASRGGVALLSHPASSVLYTPIILIYQQLSCTYKKFMACLYAHYLQCKFSKLTMSIRKQAVLIGA